MFVFEDEEEEQPGKPTYLGTLSLSQGMIPEPQPGRFVFEDEPQAPETTSHETAPIAQSSTATEIAQPAISQIPVSGNLPPETPKLTLQDRPGLTIAPELGQEPHLVQN
jgi:hypothetical protein